MKKLIKISPLPFFVFISTLTVLSVGFLLTGCRAPHSGTIVKNVTVTPYWPEWKYLSEFRGDIPLPALYTEGTDQFLHCCISGTGDIDTTDPELNVDEKCLNMLTVSRKVKPALFALVKSTLPEEESRKRKDIISILSTWHIIVYGINYHHVNPESIRLEFENDYCAVPDSSWYRGGREIAVGAVVIDSILFISEKKLAPKSIALVEECMHSRDLKSPFGLVFRLDKSPKGHYRIVVRNIFYAIRTISPYVRKIQLSFDTLYAGKKYSYNGINFTINDYRYNPDLYHFSIDPPRGRKRTYCGVLGKNRSFAVNAKSIGTIKPRKTDYGYQADITLSVIGIKQDHVTDFLH